MCYRKEEAGSKVDRLIEQIDKLTTAIGNLVVHLNIGPSTETVPSSTSLK